jgi:hypothetical protein
MGDSFSLELALGSVEVWMRIVILALFFFAGATALGQSGPFGPLNPNPSGNLPSPLTAQSRDFGKLPPGWPATLNTLPQTVIEPLPPAPHLTLGDAQIDPKILVHPAQSRLRDQPPGTQIAQNQFPGLELLPIQWPNAKIKPIPTVWPNLKMEPIPTICGLCTTVPVGTSVPAVATSPTK